MVAVLKVFDEEIGQGRSLHSELRIAAEQVTVADILRARIQSDLAVASDAPNFACDLSSVRLRDWMIVPSLKEQTLNGDRGWFGPGTEPAGCGQNADCERLSARAIDGLLKNRFIMFVDDRQMTSPDQRVSLRPDSSVVFVRLTPLVGG